MESKKTNAAFSYDRTEERTGVQEASPYNGDFDVQSDFVMVYGIHDIKKRALEWRRHGYVVHLMTGVAWGEYQDYLYGRFDGRDRHDEGQMDKNGRDISHGVDVPYMVPSIAFADYLIAKLKPAVDCGVEAIHLEEPEFWVRGGYSEAFKREWRIYYKEEWRDPQESCDAQYRASKLKQYLYTRMLDRLCSALKEYAMTKYGRFLRFYVPTHSLINYSQWSIVSPESALLDLPAIDGYIAQIWTGTARSENRLRGVVKERTFMTAYLEYGIMQELVRGTDRRMWFLADPIEDNPEHTWKDYRDNYYRTVTASLFHHKISDYEVCPWPSRVMRGKHPDGTGDRISIPDTYRTEIMSVMQTLRNMKQSDCVWRENKTEIGVVIADSAMFQRLVPGAADDDRLEVGLFSGFYGMALPLLEKGYAVRPVQLDNIGRYAGYLDEYKAIVMSYEFMKPESPDIHNAIANWVREGGCLTYVGDGSDPFHNIRAWWNSGICDYENPAQHLFEALGLDRNPADGLYECGNGFVRVIGYAPAKAAKSSETADDFIARTEECLIAAGLAIPESDAMVLDRGPYTIAASPGEKPNIIEGKYIDLYSSELPIIDDPVIEGGGCGLYYNLSKLDRGVSAEILAIAARPDDLKITSRSVSFRAVCVSDSRCTARIYLKRKPSSVTAVCGGKPVQIDCVYDAETSTAFIDFANSPAGVRVKIVF